MSDIAIKVENISKRYRIGLKEELHDTFFGALASWVKYPLSNFRRVQKLSKFSGDGESEDIIWALRDVSFEVNHGEVLGIIGRNGAGKTTLLKILCRITEPTSGNASIYGRVASLLEVGTGFHPELTGRENVFLNGAILGMNKAEIERKFDKIVDFSGVEKFIDTPVKRYSSGMRVRLAFAVAAHLEPEILLIDEVLAVGDIEFQKKCLGKMKDVAGEGRTVLFVSHNMGAIRSLCPRSILIESGKIITYGETDITVSQYHKVFKSTNIDVNTSVSNLKNRRGSGLVRIDGIKMQNESGEKCSTFKKGSNIQFVISYRVFETVPDLCISIGLRSGKTFEYIGSTGRLKIPQEKFTRGTKGKVTIELQNIILNPGEYPIYFGLNGLKTKAYDIVDDLTLPLSIKENISIDTQDYMTTSGGFFTFDAKLI